jgi:hypothetical protein
MSQGEVLVHEPADVVDDIQFAKAGFWALPALASGAFLSSAWYYVDYARSGMGPGAGVLPSVAGAAAAGVSAAIAVTMLAAFVRISLAPPRKRGLGHVWQYLLALPLIVWLVMYLHPRESGPNPTMVLGLGLAMTVAFTADMPGRLWRGWLAVVKSARELRRRREVPIDRLRDGEAVMVRGVVVPRHEAQEDPTRPAPFALRAADRDLEVAVDVSQGVMLVGSRSLEAGQEVRVAARVQRIPLGGGLFRASESVRLVGDGGPVSVFTGAPRVPSRVVANAIAETVFAALYAGCLLIQLKVWVSLPI